MAPHGGLCSRFRARTFVRAHGRHIDSARSASTGLLCGRLLVALVESVLAARRVGEHVHVVVSSDVSLCTSHRFG